MEFYGVECMKQKKPKRHLNNFLAFGLLLFLLAFLISCSEEKNTGERSLDSYSAVDSSSPASDTSASTQNTVQEIDGIQTVTLSWGKFNYNPEIITVSANKPVKIIADLDRLQGCFQTLVIPQLEVEHYFDEENPTLEFTPTEKGTFSFSCAMGMGKGTLIVQ